MLKDLLNSISNAKARENEKNQPDYEVKRKAKIAAATESRNLERINHAQNIARLCADLNAQIKQILEGVQGAQVVAHNNMQAYDGVNPEIPDESLLLGEVSAVSTTVEFHGKTVEFKPVCYALNGAKVRCHWAIQVSINGEIYPWAQWTIDSYANNKSTLERAMRIEVRSARKYFKVDEYLEMVFKKAFLST